MALLLCELGVLGELRALRADPSTAELPVVVLSADATERQIERLLADGATAYITKPIDVTEFLRTIDELLPAAQEPGSPSSRPLRRPIFRR